MTVAVITIVHGRHDHLEMQQAALLRSSRLPDLHIIVAMDDISVAQVGARPLLNPRIVHIPRAGRHLPLAAARNLGAREAMENGAELLVFLDVDCLPSARLVAGYERAAAHPVTCGDLLCGPVTYLPPPPPGGYDLNTISTIGAPHGARPSPSPGAVERSRSGYDLFWSLSFALSSQAWRGVGGFDETYVGYGAEDTDFARRAQLADLALAWVGDSHAFHQFHPVSSPPTEHLEDIVRNATIFHEQWDEWPMQGWLEAFEECGLVRRRRDGGYEVVDSSGVLDLAGLTENKQVYDEGASGSGAPFRAGGSA